MRPLRPFTLSFLGLCWGTLLACSVLTPSPGSLDVGKPPASLVSSTVPAGTGPEARPATSAPSSTPASKPPPTAPRALLDPLKPRPIDPELAAYLANAVETARTSGLGCKAFVPLFLASDADAAAPVLHGCFGARVACMETSGGYYFPVLESTFQCLWRLWHAPKDRASTSIPGAQDAAETDEEYTEGAFVRELPAAGTSEALVVRGYTHPETGNHRSEVYHHAPGGQMAVDLLFDSVKDIDGDGRLDGVLLHDIAPYDPCAPQDNPLLILAAVVGPTLYAHQLPDGSFTLADATALDARKKDCSHLAPVQKAGEVDESALARQLLCRAADGEAAAVLLRELDAICLHTPPGTHCPKPLPGSCFAPNDVQRWVKRVEQVRTQLSAGPISQRPVPGESRAPTSAR